MVFRDIQFAVFHFNDLPSTNIHAHGMLADGTITRNSMLSADYQTKGKGQRNKAWESDASKNLLFSFVVFPDFQIDQLFYWNKWIALFIRKWIANLTAVQVEIKWPNDILIEGKKIAGILIENSLQGQRVKSSIVGVGINVNQTTFKEFSRQATSLKMLIGHDFGLDELRENILFAFKEEWGQLSLDKEQIDEEYHQHLHGKGKSLRFSKGLEEFTAKVISVNESGQLLLEREGVEEKFDQGEISFID